MVWRPASADKLAGPENPPEERLFRVSHNEQITLGDLMNFSTKRKLKRYFEWSSRPMRLARDIGWLIERAQSYLQSGA